MIFRDNLANNSDCGENINNECMTLASSLTSLQVYPNDHMIRLAITTRLSLPLHLTLHHGFCNISCEGGHIENCYTEKQHFYWPNVSVPFQFQNCDPLYHYCATVSVGEDCCSFCTETVLMTENKPQIFSVTGFQWMSLLGFTLIALMLVFGAFIFNIYGITTSKKKRFEKVVSKPLNTVELDLGYHLTNKTAVCLYSNKEHQTFQDNVNSVQDFLRNKEEFNVIDLHSEEEAINVSLYNWVQNIMMDQNTRIILFDSELLRSMCTYCDVQTRLKPTEEAILYILQCIHVENQYNKMFIVRFQDCECREKGFIHLENGRRYKYPENRERLVKDLMI